MAPASTFTGTQVAPQRSREQEERGRERPTASGSPQACWRPRRVSEGCPRPGKAAASLLKKNLFSSLRPTTSPDSDFPAGGTDPVAQATWSQRERKTREASPHPQSRQASQKGPPWARAYGGSSLPSPVLLCWKPSQRTRARARPRPSVWPCLEAAGPEQASNSVLHAPAGHSSGNLHGASSYSSLEDSRGSANEPNQAAALHRPVTP